MKTDDEILEWFYTHDDDWQGRTWEESNAENDHELIAYLKKEYGFLTTD